MQCGQTKPKFIFSQLNSVEIVLIQYKNTHCILDDIFSLNINEEFSFHAAKINQGNFLQINLTLSSIMVLFLDLYI